MTTPTTPSIRPAVQAQSRGLTESEALARRQRGQGNDAKVQTSRSYAEIIRQNVFTFINIILFVIGAVLISLGRFTDAVLSVGLIVLNVGIAVFQEARAKQKLDQIALLTRPKVHALRDGHEKQIDPAEIVVGDVLVVRPGDQIVVDGVIVDDGKLEVDESLLTGESDLIPKTRGDKLLSGSFVVTGTAMYEAEKVGAESFANKLTAGARAFRVVKTPLQRDIDLAIRILMLIAIFIGFLLLTSAVLYSIPLMRSVQMAAVTAGLVPNGLFFMVIVAYALGALRIAGRGALIQQTNAIESLSNVNVLCMDKTGTLTANKIKFNNVEPLGIEQDRLREILGDFARSSTVGNRTSEAIAEALDGQKRAISDEVPFSSARKWSALVFNEGDLRGAYVLGALEMLQPYLSPEADLSGLAAQAKAYSEQGLRVVLFAHQPQAARLHDANNQPALPANLIPLGLLTFSDELRPEARETLAGFARAGVRLKVISGDNPHTVAALAKQAGLPGDLKAISGPELDGMDDATLETIAEETTIFGRITPQQKERLVDALRKRGAYVAMIGDGVNDVLSLKKANLGIAMQSGSAATRSVADIVLLNDSFGALPPAFLEGQRIVSGMRDILCLFLTRAAYVALLIIATSVVGVGFPYVPAHVSLLTLLTVGVPTFALALWARSEVPRQGLLHEIIRFVFPAAVSIFVFGLMIYLFYFVSIYTGSFQIPVRPADIATFETYAGITVQESSMETFNFEVAGVIARTALTLFTTLAGLMLIVFVEPPNSFFAGGDTVAGDRRPAVLAGLMLAAFVAINVVPVFRKFFELIVLRPEDYLLIAGVTLLWVFVLRYAWRARLFERFFGIP